MGTRIWGQPCSGSTSCPRCSPGTDTRRRFPEIRSSPTFFPQPTRIRKPKGQPVSPPSPPHPTAAPTPGDISIPLLAPHQSPPAPAGTTLHPQKHWHRSPAPRLARQKKEPTMCHNSPIVPRSHRAPSHPPRGCPTRSVPSRDPLLPSGWLVKAGGEGGMATVGTPTPAPQGAQQQVWGCCPGGATEGGCFMAETVLPHGWQGRGGRRASGPAWLPTVGGSGPPGQHQRLGSGIMAGIYSLRLTAAPAPSCHNGVSSKESTCRRSPGDPAGSQPGPKAGSVPTVTGVPFQPRCDDSTPIFPGGTLAPALPSSSHFPSTAGERDRPSVPASSHPRRSTCSRDWGPQGFARQRPNPSGTWPIPTEAAAPTCRTTPPRVLQHAATSAKVCSLRCGPRRQLGKI